MQYGTFYQQNKVKNEKKTTNSFNLKARKEIMLIWLIYNRCLAINVWKVQANKDISLLY